MLQTPITGQLVSLRLAKTDDAGQMLEALEPASTTNLRFFSKPVSAHRQVQYLRRMIKSATDMLFVITRLDDGKMVGTIGLHEVDTHLKLARLGLLIFRQADRGRDFGNEATALLLEYAFGTLSLNKVYVNLFETNVRSQQHYYRLGFTAEGRLREEYLLGETYHDVSRMSILKREWAARRVAQGGNR